jgi:hypothetical protein
MEAKPRLPIEESIAPNMSTVCKSMASAQELMRRSADIDPKLIVIGFVICLKYINVNNQKKFKRRDIRKRKAN